MATNVTDKLFEALPRLAGKVGAGGVTSTSATTIPHTFVGLTNGNCYIVTANRTNAAGTAKNPLNETETFIGKVSSGNFIECVRAVEGVAQAWAANTVLEILFTATGWNKLVEAILVEHGQDGTHASTIVKTTASQTLTNKTLTAPKVGTAIADTNGNEVIKTPATTNAVNEITVTNAATGNSPVVEATGGDTNINLDLKGKGTGVVRKPTSVAFQVVASDTDVETGDGKVFFPIPAELNGMKLVGVFAAVYTAGTTGTTDIQIRNVTDSVDMLSTKLTIDSTETTSATAAKAAVIDGTKDGVATNDILAIDIDATSTTKAKGLIVRLSFALP